MCPTTTGEDDPLINPFVDGASGLEALACGRVLVCNGEGDTISIAASGSTSGMPSLPLPHPLLEREGLDRARKKRGAAKMHGRDWPELDVNWTELAVDGGGGKGKGKREMLHD
ncbi:hypothetical protein ZWY2020_054792 [Hordeum vulgare]|nr:hypothetical protein ZWY2020_054792 [Hordeum vulgare]